MYIQVHYNPKERLVVEHLIDNLAETTLGHTNLELKKNITIDMFDSDGDQFLRDNAGFIVADRLKFHQVTVDAQQMLRLMNPNSSKIFFLLNKIFIFKIKQFFLLFIINFRH